MYIRARETTNKCAGHNLNMLSLTSVLVAFITISLSDTVKLQNWAIFSPVSGECANIKFWSS